MAVKSIKSTLCSLFTIINFAYILRSGNVSAACDHPGEPINGEAIPDKSEYSTGEEITFRCSQSLVLIGEKKTICLANSSWSSPVPHCGRNVVLGKEPECITKKLEKDLKELSHVTDGNFQTCLRKRKELTLILYFERQIDLLAVNFSVKGNSIQTSDIQVKIIRDSSLTNAPNRPCSRRQTAENKVITYQCEMKPQQDLADGIQVSFYSTLEICEISVYSVAVNTRCLAISVYKCPKIIEKCNLAQECMDGLGIDYHTFVYWVCGSQILWLSKLPGKYFQIKEIYTQTQTVKKCLGYLTDDKIASSQSLTVNNSQTVLIQWMGIYDIEMFIFTMNLKNPRNRSLYIDIEIGNNTEDSYKFDHCRRLLSKIGEWIDNTIKFTCWNKLISGNAVKLNFHGTSNTRIDVNLYDFQVLTTQTHLGFKRPCKSKKRSQNCVAREMIDSNGTQYLFYSPKKNYTLYGTTLIECVGNVWKSKPPYCIHEISVLQVSANDQTYKILAFLFATTCIVIVAAGIFLIVTKRVKWVKQVYNGGTEDQSNVNSYEEMNNEIYDTSSLEKSLPPSPLL